MRAMLIVGSVLSLTGALAADGPAPLRVGAKLVKVDVGMAAVRPEVVVTGPAGRWRLLDGEALSGENGREFFFTLEGPADSALPAVEVRWPGVRIARVLGADGPVDLGDGVTRFTVRRGAVPTGVRTTLKTGRNIYLCVFHNWEVRRAGPYREGPWPAAAIQAQLNYLLAAREAAKLMGLAEAEDPGFTGDVRLYGFETNFPNGHVDHPPHFHIMLGWPGWQGTQATHFRLDADGRILHNQLQVDYGGGKTEAKSFAPGEVCRPVDREGRVGFELAVATDGQGLSWHWPAGKVTYLLRAVAGGAAEAVEVCAAAEGGGWEPRLRVRAEDDAVHGELRVTLTPTGGPSTTEVVRYDPDTGAELPAAAAR